MIEYKSDVEAVQAFTQKYAQLRQEVAKVIVGQDEVLKNILITILEISMQRPWDCRATASNLLPT